MGLDNKPFIGNVCICLLYIENELFRRWLGYPTRNSNETKALKGHISLHGFTSF